MNMMSGSQFPFLGFIIYLIILFAIWYLGILILRWVLGTQKMIEELKKQNQTLTEILTEIRKKP
ncbi:MAG: hypothetical protein ACRCR2_05190 [Fusobacteriaceae bacterium]